MNDSSIYSLVAVGVVVDFIMAYVPLWAAAQIVGMNKKKHRLFLGALCATVVFILILLLAAYGAMDLTSLPSAALAVLSIPISVFAAFTPVRPLDLLRLSGLTCFFALLAAGTWMAVNTLTGWQLFGAGWDMITGLIISIGVVLLVAELGWGIVHRRMKEALYFVPIRLFFDGSPLEVTALIDTGNQLKDPLTGSPVVIVEYDVIRDLVPADMRAIFDMSPGSPYEVLSQIKASSLWAPRIRLIPFSSLGNEKGMLLGVKPDRVEVVEGETSFSFTNVVVGIHLRKLSQSGDYHALLHPELLVTA